MPRSTIVPIHLGKLLPIKPKFKDGLELGKGMVTRLSLPLSPKLFSSEEHPQSPRGGMASGSLELEPKTIEPSISGSQPLLQDLPGTAEEIRLIVPQGSKEQDQASLQT